MSVGNAAIWLGYALALLGVSGMALSGSQLISASLEGGVPAVVGAVLLIGGLAVIAFGIRREWRRRDQVEAGLRQAEGLLRKTVAALEQRVAVLDLAGQVLASTRVVEAGAGEAVAAEPGAEPLGLIPGVGTAYVPELEELRSDPTPQARAIWGGIHAVLEGRQREFQLEYPVQGEGETRWFLMRVVRLPEGDGAARVAVVNEEITERVIAARALGESEGRFRSLVTSIDDLVFALDQDETFQCAYGHWLEREGVDATALQGRTVGDAFGEESGRVIGEVGRRVLEGEHLLSDWVLTGKRGPRRLQTSLSPLRVADGTIAGIVGVGRDVTDQVQMEDELRRRDAILETIGFASSHFLRSTDWAASIRDVLEHLARATGSVRVDLCERLSDGEGRSVLRLRQEWSAAEAGPGSLFTMHGDVVLDDPGLRRWVERLSAGEPVFVKVRKLKDPQRSTLLTNGIQSMALLPIFLGKQWAGVLGFDDADERIWSASEVEALRIAADVFAAALDRMRIEEALQESEAQLQQAQKMEAVGRLAGGVAHDFNNLLTAIKGRTELLLSEGKEAEHFESDLVEIRAATIRAATLTRQLLAFSRRQVLEPKVLDLNQIVREIESMLRRLIGEDVILMTRLAPDLGSVQADPGHVEQVLMNLLVNARDAMPEGGAITIQTANLELDRRAARIEGVNEPGTYILLQVSDTGCGIPAELHERIFEPFFTTKEQGKGTGLGLSMSWGIVKQSGGHISVRSVVGEGTQFRILLPRGATIASPSLPIVAPPSPSTGTETVLLVEDEAAVRSLVRKVLERRGYLVLEATNGAEAIQLAQSHEGRIDLILTDVVMPDIAGPTLIEMLAPHRSEARVLFMSGYTDQEIIRRGVDKFQAGFIGKPFSPDALAAKVREILDAGVPGETVAAN
jgi:PAS domain S-box-containing protein